MNFLDNYQLLDSGAGEKLERFGEKIVKRPSSICLWNKTDQKLWGRFDAEFVPKIGWKFQGKPFETWPVNFGPIDLELRLQTSGLVGVFPEHLGYFNDIADEAAEIMSRGVKAPKVLNLFAYTGAASVWASKLGCHTTHVDLSKKALSWADANFKMNNIDPSRLRLISDDALKFAAKEIKRGAAYDIVIVDPPTFSRIDKNKSWKLEDMIAGIIKDCAALCSKNGGALFATCHDPMISPQILKNIMFDNFKSKSVEISGRDLIIDQSKSPKSLPAGHLAFARLSP